MFNPTPKLHGPSLCQSCRHAQITKGTTLGDELVICGKLSAPSDRLTFRVVECSTYDDKAHPSLAAMQAVAWELCTDRKANRIGFFSPQDRQLRRDLVRPSYLDPDEL